MEKHEQVVNTSNVMLQNRARNDRGKILSKMRVVSYPNGHKQKKHVFWVIVLVFFRKYLYVGQIWVKYGYLGQNIGNLGQNFGIWVKILVFGSKYGGMADLA